MYQNHGAAAELYARVEAACANTPYQLTRTEQGFDLSTDIRQPRWRNLMYERTIRETMIHRVKLDESKKELVIDDQLYSLIWGAMDGDAPVVQLGPRVTRQSGRVIEVSSYKTIGGGGDGQTEQYRFDSEEGRRLITGPAKELGWSVKWSIAAKVGLVAAVIGLVAALVGVAAVLLVAK